MMSYDHRLLVTQATQRVSDGMGGFEDTGEELVYDGWADVQDRGSKVQTEEGVVTEEGDATAFLPQDAPEPTAFAVGDEVVIAWPSGGESEATIARVVRLDKKLVLSYD
jgi:hypothetical protein